MNRCGPDLEPMIAWWRHHPKLLSHGEREGEEENEDSCVKREDVQGFVPFC